MVCAGAMLALNNLQESVVRKLLAVAMVLSLTACFDVEQRLVVAGDTATYDALVVVKSDTLETLEDWSEDDHCDIQVDELDNELPDGVEKRVTQRVDEAGLHCGVTYEGPISAMRQLTLTKTGEGKSQLFAMRELGPDYFRIESRYDDQVEVDDGAMARVARNLLARMFNDTHLSWYLEASAIIASNGEIAEDGKSVRWKTSLSDIIKGDAERVFYVEFSTHPTGAIEI